MSRSAWIGGKREVAAQLLYRTGLSSVLRALGRAPVLAVLNYHRIGDPLTDPYDPGVFSARQDEFADQVAYLKRNFGLLTEDEVLEFVDSGKARWRSGVRFFLTFDDGYLDNYTLAFPVLKSHGAQALFFLAPEMVGTAHLPWWDEIAHIVRTAKSPTVRLTYPAPYETNVRGASLTRGLQEILRLYKRPETHDGERFINELIEATGGVRPTGVERRFLNWDEARQMQSAGMAFGSHSWSHTVLSQQTLEEQLRELKSSRAEITRQLGREVRSVAYPVGKPSSFTVETERIAEHSGYRAGFAFYGGWNRPGATNRFHIKRMDVDQLSVARFRAKVNTVGRTHLLDD